MDNRLGKLDRAISLIREYDNNTAGVWGTDDILNRLDEEYDIPYVERDHARQVLHRVNIKDGEFTPENIKFRFEELNNYFEWGYPVN